MGINLLKRLCSRMTEKESLPYPSTAFPLDFTKGRAARIGLGSFANKPILIWAEGAGKLGYVKKRGELR